MDHVTSCQSRDSQVLWHTDPHYPRILILNDMEHILERIKVNGSYARVDIADVGAGAATLYVLNGGAWPPTAAAGDFAYDVEKTTMEIFDKGAWRAMTIKNVESRLWNPKGNGATICFTDRGVPFWTNPDESEDPCEFRTVEDVLERFIKRFDARKIRVHERPSVY